jgi:hypothetical protein
MAHLRRDRVMWGLPEALQFLTNLRAAVWPVGYTVALTGSVLHHGHSSKDLDIIIYPLDTSKQDRAALEKALQDFGLHRTHDRENVRGWWKELNPTSEDEKHVEVWGLLKEGVLKRMDFFFLS